MLLDYLSESLSALVNPAKRVYWLYLLSAFVIAVVWLIAADKLSIRNSLKQIFSTKVWLSRSAIADYCVLFINSLLMIKLSGFLLAKSAVAYFLYEFFHSSFNGLSWVNHQIPLWLLTLVFTLFLFVLDDFTKYWLHRWLHTNPLLWKFHQVHHSATSLNPFTVFRTHPLEAVLFSVRGAIVQGATIALFFYGFGGQLTLVTILGANAFIFMFNIFGSNLRHSPVSLRYWHHLEKIFISPAQHHIHHSIAVEHHNKNYGVVFAVWDWLFGTLHHSCRQTLSYGLAGKVETHNVLKLYFTPFFSSFQLMVKPLSYFKSKYIGEF